MNKNGGWIFLSHSHQDIEIVRKIRNRLEAMGFEPLLFYLKCLNDDDEIENLIKREIDEREWFIYVDSANSRASKWVSSEREYIASLTGKKVMTIDLNGDITRQVDAIGRSLKVFISGPARQRALTEQIEKALVDRDFLVLNSEHLSADGIFAEEVESMIDEASREGFVLLLITPESADSRFVEQELRAALHAGGKIVPVYVDDAVLSPELQQLVGDIQGVHISATPTKEELEAIISEIEHRIEYYRSDFTVSAGFVSAVNIKYPYVASIPAYTFADCDELERVAIPNCVTYISEDAFPGDRAILVYCEQDSFAESFCISHGMPYELIDNFETFHF